MGCGALGRRLDQGAKPAERQKKRPSVAEGPWMMVVYGGWSGTLAGEVKAEAKDCSTSHAGKNPCRHIVILLLSA